jgi:hypothetical protein
VQKLKTRIEHMEKQLAPPVRGDTILVLPWEDVNIKLQEYQQKYPDQLMPDIIEIKFVKAQHSGQLETERKNENGQ